MGPDTIRASEGSAPGGGGGAGEPPRTGQLVKEGMRAGIPLQDMGERFGRRRPSWQGDPLGAHAQSNKENPVLSIVFKVPLGLGFRVRVTFRGLGGARYFSVTPISPLWGQGKKV